MSIGDLLDKARMSDNPRQAGVEIVQALLAEGYERNTILDELEQYRAVLQQEGQAEWEDVILEVMDFLTGWCSPHMTI